MLRILIVEDEVPVVADLQRLLGKREDTFVCVAADAKEALRQAADIPPDLVLIDIKLHGELNGEMAGELLRKQIDVPIIYLATSSEAAAIAQTKLAYPGGYLEKPISSHELELSIEIARLHHDAEQKLRKNEAQLQLLYRQSMSLARWLKPWSRPARYWPHRWM